MGGSSPKWCYDGSILACLFISKSNFLCFLALSQTIPLDFIHLNSSCDLFILLTHLFRSEKKKKNLPMNCRKPSWKKNVYLNNHKLQLNNYASLQLSSWNLLLLNLKRLAKSLQQVKLARKCFSIALPLMFTREIPNIKSSV